MQIVEVVPHPYCPICFTDRSAAPPSRPGACCLIENSCRPLSENRVAFWSHRRFQRLRGDRAAAVETNPHLFGRFMSQICIRVWDRKAVGEHDRAPALEARRRGRRTTLHFVSIRHSAWPSPHNGPAQGAFQDVRWPAARRSAGGEARPHWEHGVMRPAPRPRSLSGSEYDPMEQSARGSSVPSCATR
jgi:hypothetical protein